MREEQRRKITSITRSTTHSGAHYGASRDRSAFGYWIPLALTVTAATVGVVAWIWSERDDADSESEPEHYYANAARPSGPPGPGYGNRESGAPTNNFGGDAAAAAAAAGIGAAAGYSGMSGRPPPGPGPTGAAPSQGGFVPGPPTQGGFQGPPPGASMAGPGAAASYFNEQSRDIHNGPPQEEQTFFGRMSNALGMSRGGTSNYSGGWASGALAAAGSMVGGAVNSVRGTGETYEETERRNVSVSGEQRTHFSDQEKWSEEADKPERRDTMSPRKSQQFGSAAAAGLGAAALGSIAAGGSRSGSRVDSRRTSAAPQGSTRESFVDTRGSAVDAGSTRGSVMERPSMAGSAAEFYSGAVDVPHRSSVTATNRKTVAIVVSSLEKGDGSAEVDMHQVSSSYPCSTITNVSVVHSCTHSGISPW